MSYLPQNSSSRGKHHWVFARVALHEVCRKDPLAFVAMMTPNLRTKFIAGLWDLVCARCDGHGSPGCSPADIKVAQKSTEKHLLTLVLMPPPTRANEAYFVAVYVEHPKDRSSRNFRYFLLERGEGLNEEMITFVCELRDDARYNYGPGPRPNPFEFLRFVEQLPPNGWALASHVVSNSDPLILPSVPSVS
jgi:hypothetical protein